jgi:Flp pilus assembly pilin Flp
MEGGGMTEWDVSQQEAHQRLDGDRGSNLVEYTLLLALILIVCLSALTVFGRNATNKMNCAGSVISQEIPNVTC